MVRQTVILPDEGFEAGDTNWWARVPNQTNAGLGVAKDPLAGAFIALTHFPGLNKLGYVVAQQDNTAGTRIRFITTDHPDGP